MTSGGGVSALMELREDSISPLAPPLLLGPSSLGLVGRGGRGGRVAVHPHWPRQVTISSGSEVGKETRSLVSHSPEIPG